MPTSQFFLKVVCISVSDSAYLTQHETQKCLVSGHSEIWQLSWVLQTSTILCTKQQNKAYTYLEALQSYNKHQNSVLQQEHKSSRNWSLSRKELQLAIPKFPVNFG